MPIFTNALPLALESLKSNFGDLLGAVKPQEKSETLNEVLGDITLPTVTTGLDNKTMLYGVGILALVFMFFIPKSHKNRVNRKVNTYRQKRTLPRFQKRIKASPYRSKRTRRIRRS